MNNPTISVIVPVYKVEAYLQECIDSILAQTFQDFELILVNDGSPDSCGEICERNAAKDTRIRVIHQKNQGVTRARANGVAAASGEFINFVDGDDTLPPDSLSTLMAPVNNDIDIIIGNHQRAPSWHICQIGCMSAEKYKQRAITLKGLLGSPCSKLYRKHLFNNEVFDIPPCVKRGEDAIMNIHIAYRLKKQAYQTGAIVYHYRNNSESAVNTLTSPKFMAIYQEYRLKAITDEDRERYLPLGLADSLMAYWISATHRSIWLPASTRAAHRYLVSIMKYSSIKFDFLNKALFRSYNPICRATIRGIQKLLGFFKKLKRFGANYLGKNKQKSGV